MLGAFKTAEDLHLVLVCLLQEIVARQRLAVTGQNMAYSEYCTPSREYESHAIP